MIQPVIFGFSISWIQKFIYFYQSIVDLQCCVNFRCAAYKHICMCIYTYLYAYVYVCVCIAYSAIHIYIYFFQILFPLLVITKY